MFGKTVHYSLFACLVLGAITIRPARAQSAAVGINVHDEGALSQSDQDVEIKRLAQDGVKTIRTGLSDKTVYFITQAFRHGIGTVAIIYPTWGSEAKHRLRWSDAPLSGADPRGFAEWLKPFLDQLEAAGVRLTAMELGNEINNSGFNGDIPVPGTGRVLGLSDLNNAEDPEGPSIANGFRNYLRVMEALKDARDHSKVNKATPIIVAGLADWGLPSTKAWDGRVGVSVPDTIEFLRQIGMDKLVDGYGVHVYPTGNPKVSVAGRISELEKKKIFSECTKAKPCWLTEWGIPNRQSCPIDDTKRIQVIEAERGAFKPFFEKGLLVSAIYYVWSGYADKEDPMAVFRCGALTEAGKAALRPM